MRHRHAVQQAELGGLAEEVRRLFQDLDQSAPSVSGAATGECQPALDVLDADGALHVVLDVPGVPADRIRVLYRDGIVLVAGDKQPPVASLGAADYHLVERGYGRFARAIRLTGACDASRIIATLAHGELRIVLPRIADRRGRAVRVPITS